MNITIWLWFRLLKQNDKLGLLVFISYLISTYHRRRSEVVIYLKIRMMNQDERYIQKSNMSKSRMGLVSVTSGSFQNILNSNERTVGQLSC